MNYDSLFEIPFSENIGTVNRVDSYSVTIYVPDEEILRRVNVNGFVLIHTNNPNIRLIGRIDRIIKTEISNNLSDDNNGELQSTNDNLVYINALGTLTGIGGGRETHKFSRAVEILPEIGAYCFLLNGNLLSTFTRLIANQTSEESKPLILGNYTLSDEALAVLDGDAFFQRHALIVGSTGSGKSWTVATIIEQASNLPSSNLILFDLHGEYSTLEEHDNIKRYRIAGPGDHGTPQEEVLYLPYWLLGYEDMLALILDRSDENAPNQAMAFSKLVIDAKRNKLTEEGLAEVLETFTIDSPVAYDIDLVLSELVRLNDERIINPSTNRENNGPFNGKFNRFIPRLQSKMSDRRYGFLFSLNEHTSSSDYLNYLVSTLMTRKGSENAGIKVIDFSEVPSDILPIVVSLVARLVFQIQQWTPSEERFPIALFCDEAHLYLPSRQVADASELRALNHFERIAKEGRKYGVSLVVISQRPSELNTTIISQCNNVLSLRLSNSADKSAISNMLPENLGGIKDVLPTLGIGEAIVIGDASLLPARIKVFPPTLKPVSGSIDVWSIWNSEQVLDQNLDLAVNNLRRQTF